MRDSSRARVPVTAIAAYLVALQALLLPLSVIAAAPFLTSHCTSVSAEGNAGPVGQTGCPCAAGCGMQCCVQALLAPPPVVVEAAQSFAGAMVPEARLAGVVRPVSHRPHIPRAPPVA